MENPVRVGLVGLGEVAQTVHIPVLQQMPERFQITGICDISQELLGKYRDLPTTVVATADHEELVQSSNVDVVFVLNSDVYHSMVARAALKAGKDVFVEKPMCLTIREAEELQVEQDRTDRIVFVGYMRRYAEAFLALKEDLGNLGNPVYVNLRDIVGPNKYFVQQTHRVHYPTDIPQCAAEERQARGSEMVQRAVGDVPDHLKRSYRLLCGLGVHDLSLMRELFGLPSSVTSADVWRDGQFIRATFDYGAFRIGYETGIHRHGRFDAVLEIIGEKGIGAVRYNTPYIRNLPALYEQCTTSDDSYTVTNRRPTYSDPYTAEFIEFHACLTERRSSKTDIADSMEDLRLVRSIVLAAHTRKETTI